MKMAKKPNSIKPSVRLMTLLPAPSSKISLAQTKSISAESTHKGISLANVPLPTGIGATMAVHPTIISVLNMLLPTTLPIASPALPLKEERKLMTNSGAEVPKATMVSPITRLEMLKRLATEAAPSVKAFAPQRMSNKPPTSNNASIIFNFYVILFKRCRHQQVLSPFGIESKPSLLRTMWWQTGNPRLPRPV